MGVVVSDGYVEPRMEVPRIPFDTGNLEREARPYSKAALLQKALDAKAKADLAEKEAKLAVAVADQIAAHFTASVKALHEDREKAFATIQASQVYAKGAEIRASLLEGRLEQAQRRLWVLLTLGAVQTVGTVAYYLWRS